MSKGQQTRAAILSEALRAASVEGFQGISIGMLAERMKMSKSGLFAHFGSKEELEKAMLDDAAERFTDQVWRPALREPRGRPRVEAVFRNTIDWMLHNDALPGGCIFMTLANEVDDKPGPVRDHLVEMQQRWQATLARSAQIAIQEGHFHPNVDPRQFAYELQGIVMSMNYHRRLLRDPGAVQRAERAFADLLARSAAPPVSVQPYVSLRPK